MKLITEQIEDVQVLTEERDGKKLLYIEGVFLQSELKNRNGRMYPFEVLNREVERYNEVGQVVRVTLRWRGKIYYLQMFFPGSKFPSRGEVETQVKKIYPDSVVMVHYASETQQIGRAHV